MATHEVTRPLALNVTALEIAQALQDVIVTLPVVDNLTTNDGSKALSAKMGKKLNDEKFPIANIASALGQDVDKVPSNKVVDDAINAIMTIKEQRIGELLIQCVGKVVTINGYIDDLNITSSTLALGTIDSTKIPLPVTQIRTVCNVGDNAYSANEQGYFLINTQGAIGVQTKSGTASTFYVSCSYIA